MLYPSIPQLITDHSKQFRYSLVIAVAKEARVIADEKEAEGERLEDRAVSLAVKAFADGKASYSEDRSVSYND